VYGRALRVLAFSGKDTSVPVKANKLAGLSPRSARSVPLLDDPPLGHLQALILKTLDDLGSDAFGYGALEKLSIESGVWIDHSQIYATIRRFLNRDPPLIEHVTTREQKRGPPLKIYKLTVAGRAALKATAVHYRAVSDFLESKRR
jgi:DNA-binding PadR family transcriptional regulator